MRSKRKPAYSLWRSWGREAELDSCRLALFLASLSSVLALVGLLAAIKNDNPSLWIFPLVFGGSSLVMTYRVLAHMGLLKRRR